MTRIRFSSPGYLETTRRRTVYSPKAYDDLYVPTFVYPRHRIDTTGEENAIRRSVNDELVYTTHVVDDTYDLAAKSRNRDQEILRDANRAIVDTEFYHSPKAAVAARRARSHPPASTVTVTQQTSRLSSVPPRPVVVTAPPPYVRRPRQYYESQAKAHWDEYGDVTKPKNLLSWKYRLDARMKPDDLLYQPTTYNTLHSRLRNVHDKMDRHRQLMDRYLDANIRPHTEDVKTRVMSMPPTGASTKLNSDLAESRNTPSEEPSKSKDDYKPMSDVRRRVRRVICKNRNDPKYFKN